MRELAFRILRRSIPVGIALAVMGYVFAEVWLMINRQFGGIQDPANDEMRWRTPLKMVAFGISMLVIMELLLFAIRGNKPAAPKTSDKAETPTGDKPPEPLA